MNPSKTRESKAARWQRVKPLLERVLSAPTYNRETVLREVCGGDADLEAGVREYLQVPHHGSFLEQNCFNLDSFKIQSPVGTRLGSFFLERELGRGGMGSVYLGRNFGSGNNAPVAIKLLHRGLNSDLILRRFQLEGHILKALNHPNIASFIGGGVTESGLPYHVMEYVDGRPLHCYCRENQLTLQQRLRLFLKIAGAVQFAHQHRVIHRDLKPGNILVDRRGEPVLLDFGIAKLVQPRTREADTVTTPTMRAMTPEYASPEQLDGAPVARATDVYSLGVLFYELISGRRPYDLKARRKSEILRLICDIKPRKPSVCLTRGGQPLARCGPPAADPDAAMGSSPERQLKSSLCGSLDRIAMKAMQKLPQRRYPTVAAMTDDLRKTLRGRETFVAKTAPEGPLVDRVLKGRFLSFRLLVLCFLSLVSPPWIEPMAEGDLPHGRVYADCQNAADLSVNPREMAPAPWDQQGCGLPVGDPGVGWSGPRPALTVATQICSLSSR